jgi:predicted transcriptional regulator
MYKNVELTPSLDIHFLGPEKGMENMDIRLRNSGRDRIAIVAEILEMAREGVLKTNIMYRAGLNSLMLNKYLGLMTNAKLLEKVLLNGRVVFKATKRGTEFLHYCYEITRLLEPEDGKNKIGERVQLLPSSL